MGMEFKVNSLEEMCNNVVPKSREREKERNMKKYQCYYNETIICDGRKYIGKRVNMECFNTEEKAEQYCISHVGTQKCSDGTYIENEIRYEEIVD